MNKKQYNFNKEYYVKKNFDIFFKFCEYNDIQSILYAYLQNKVFTNVNGIDIECDYLYYYNNGERLYNNNLYSKWLITLSLSIFILLIQVCYIIFMIILKRDIF